MPSPKIKVLEMQRNDVGSGEVRQQVRALNPGPSMRRPSLKRMIALGSVVLERLGEVASDPEMQREIQVAWEKLRVGWSSTRGDQRVALTSLQQSLLRWTAEDAFVADANSVQQYRKQLHLVLDH